MLGDKIAMPTKETPRCVHDPSKYCEEHTEMVRSYNMGMAILGVGKWLVPFMFALFGSIIGFLFNDVRSLEAEYVRQHGIHEVVHRKVNTMEFNLVRLFKLFDMEYIEPEEG